jgi:hypothetical protein
MRNESIDNPYRPIKSTAAYRRLMMAYYFMVKHPRWFGKKVAWITSGGPVEPLYAMGVLPFSDLLLRTRDRWDVSLDRTFWCAVTISAER